jgi:hypothetical protein
LPVLWSPSSFLSTAGNLSSETIAQAIPQPARTRRGSCLPPAPEKERPFIPVLKRTGLSGPFSVRRNIPDLAIKRLLAIRSDPAFIQTVREAADDALSEILSLETGIEPLLPSQIDS